MIIAIVGSRNYPDLRRVDEWCRVNVDPTRDTIISGGAKGVDRAAVDWAIDHECSEEEYLADWETFGKSAGYKRNIVIVSNADKVVAFWDGESKGTKHTIDLTLKVGKCLEVITPKCL